MKVDRFQINVPHEALKVPSKARHKGLYKRKVPSRLHLFWCSTLFIERAPILEQFAYLQVLNKFTAALCWLRIGRDSGVKGSWTLPSWQRWPRRVQLPKLRWRLAGGGWSFFLLLLKGAGVWLVVFFPTCQVRVVRFYQSYSSFFSFSFSSFSSPIVFANSGWQWAPLDLNQEDPSEHRWTSTARIRSQWAPLDLNAE